MKPLLYTFRRCPYAIRARLAIGVSGVAVDKCEVDLRNKPKALLDCSPKGTVPVLQFSDGSVIEESLDIMQWALAINDPEEWLGDDNAPSVETLTLIHQNDGPFKAALDRYKYAVRFPEHPAATYREQAANFLSVLNTRISKHGYLMRNRADLADLAIFPFIRQFANVDKDWFYQSEYKYLIKWLDTFLASALFNAVMQK
jgi:glutathione S-transferase